MKPNLFLIHWNASEAKSIPGASGVCDMITRGAKMSAINTAEDAVKIAEEFLQRYYYFRKLRNAKQEDHSWLVEFDVGVLKTDLVRIKLDADSGAIIEYISPEAP